eukprot:7234046-Pyramimonas_sp.AAC.1
MEPADPAANSRGPFESRKRRRLRAATGQKGERRRGDSQGAPITRTTMKIISRLAEKILARATPSDF